MKKNPALQASVSYQQSDGELRETYIKAEVARQFDHFAKPHITTLLFIMVILAVAEFHMTPPELRYWSLGFRSLVVLLTLLAIPMFREKRATMRYVLFGIEQIIGVGSALILLRTYQLGLSSQGYLAEIIMVSQFNILLSVSPLPRHRDVIITGSLYSLLTLIVLGSAPERFTVFSIVALGGFLASGLIRANYMKILRLLHGIDYDLRRRILPEALVRKTLSIPHHGLSAAVGMKSTGILCIASDWRGFSEMSQTYQATEVVKVLSLYYDECVDLMHRHFPEGECAIDWMADEFMIYVPYDTQKIANIKMCALSALNFSRDLIAVRKRFFESYGYPTGIDIGIAMGRASYGLSGTNNSRRMLAFGYPVSLARAIQHQVKRVTVHFAMQDRLTVTRDVLETLETTPETITAPADRFLSQMGVDTIHILKV